MREARVKNQIISDEIPPRYYLFIKIPFILRSEIMTSRYAGTVSSGAVIMPNLCSSAKQAVPINFNFVFVTATLLPLMSG